MVAAFCFGLIFIAAGVFLIGSGIRAVLHSKQIVNWPTTQGVIINSGLQALGGSRYTPAVKFTYTIQGQMYVGTRITLGSNWITSSSEKAKLKVEQYPVGQPCRVYYNPNNPGEAALETGAGRT